VKRDSSFRDTGSPQEDHYVLAQDGTALGVLFRGDAELFVAGNARPQTLSLPSILMDAEAIQSTAALASTPDGVAFAGQGFVGIASSANPQPRYFANGDSYIQNIVVSADGKLVVLGNIEGELYVWELR
jgi:hypothetical protein